jgi:2-polyprenyl-3-methyl-5-hydroxy-6-metoxy-1,4-benzoquinol methylase
MNRAETYCIFCGKESEEIVWIENGFVGKRCDCGLLYISPRPEPEKILNLYNSFESDVSAESRIRAEFAGRLNGRHRLKLIKNHLFEGSLLEIGSGAGYFLDESRRAGFEPFGVELNLRQAKFIKEELRIPVETNPFTESSFVGIDFDIICHFDVISHFYNPISEFKTFNKRLKDNGILFFETGNGGDLSQRWLRFIGRLQYPQHLFLFSKRNVEQLCAQTGFEIIRMHQYSVYFQLLIVKGFQLMKAGMRRFTSGKNPKVLSKDLNEISKRRSWWKVLPLKAVIYLSFLVRYKIGRFLPRFGPQTIIYVAKKIAAVN